MAPTFVSSSFGVGFARSAEPVGATDSEWQLLVRATHHPLAHMISTKDNEATCSYLGVDITDRYSDSARAMDVCGLEIGDDKLVPRFWTWCWRSPGLIDVSGLLPEIAAAAAVMLDGPQGLARVGHGIRACEKALAAAGKTGDVRPPTGQPYGGFIASSLDLFAAFHAAKLSLAPGVPTRLHEVYPAAIWTRLARRLPNKRRSAGRQARRAFEDARRGSS